MNREGRPAGSGDNSSKLSRNIIGIVAGGFLLLALAGTVTLFVPYESVRVLAARHFGSDHKRFTPAFYQGIIFRLRICGCLSAAAAGCLWCSRRTLGLACQRIVTSLSSEVRWLGGSFGATLGNFRRPAVVPAIVVLAVGFGLRWHYLSQPMRYDEASTVLFYVKPGWARILLLDYLPNNHILHTELVWLVSRVLGYSPGVVRLPAFIAGILLIPVTYQYTQRYAGPLAALFAASLVAANADLVMSSTNARGYTMLALMFLGLIQVAQLLGKEAHRIGLWVPFVGLAVLGLYTVPTMLYGLAASVGVLVVERIRQRECGPWRLLRHGELTDLAIALAVVAALTAVLYVPTMVGSGPAALLFNRFVRPESSDAFVGRMLDGITDTWKIWHAGWPVPVVVFLTACVVCAALAVWRYRESRAIQYFVLSLSICAVVAVCQRVIPPARIWIFLLPLYFAAIAAGLAQFLDRFGRNTANWGLMICTMALLVWNVRTVWQSKIVINMPDGVNIEAADVASLLAAAHQSGDALVATLPAFAPVVYYLDRGGQSFSYWSPPNPARVLAVLDKLPGREFTEAECGQALRLAFDATSPDLHPSGYHVTQTLYDSEYTRILLLERTVR